jgi:hypothetical protein
MPTTFPAEIKIKNIVRFKGDPQQLSTLDISIYDLCDGNNYPAYYGGTVTGSISTEYVYCTSGTVGSADNYIFGRRFCSKIVSEFEGDAKLWWEDYIQGGGKRPNCWKSAVLNEVEGSKPDRIVELSLFDLLSAEFPAENDQQAADVELKRYRWNPLEKDAKPFATFKSHTKSLAKRAGYSNWALQAREIRNCIEPKSLKLSVPLHNRESEFWNTMQVQVNTALADYIDEGRKCTGCGSEDHERERCPKTTIKGSSNGSPGSSRVASGGGASMHADKECFYCAKKGHIERDCRTKARDVANGTVRARTGVNCGSGVQTGSGSQPGPGGQPRQPQRIQRCRNCSGFGHSSERCSSSNNPPTGMSTARTAAAATRVDQANSEGLDQEDNPESTYVYTYMGSFINESQPPPIACFGEPVSAAGTARGSELVDEFTLKDHNNSRVPLTTLSMINAISVKDEVLSVTKDEAVTFSVPSSREATSPTGPMWSVTQTIRNEDMLTIFDTGAVKNAVTRHTVAAVGCKWTDRTDIAFVNADGIKYKPLGMCLDFPFKIGNRKFKTKVYVLDQAPFQFLLGMTFLHATGCGLFPRWNTIIMTIPSRLEIRCSSEGPNSRNSPPPLPGGSRILASELGPVSQPTTDNIEEDPMDLGAVQCNTMLTAPTLNEFVKPAVFEALAPNDIIHPVIDFIESPIEKGPEALIEWRDLAPGSGPAFDTPHNDAIIHTENSHDAAHRQCSAPEANTGPGGMMPPKLGLVVQEDHGSAIYFEKWIEPIDYAAKVIESPNLLRVVMKKIHDGTGHQQFTAIIRHFSEHLFTPCTAKLIENYIRLCHKCQQLGRIEGYSPKTRDGSRGVKVTAVKVLDAKVIIGKSGLDKSIQSEHGFKKHKRSPYYPQFDVNCLFILTDPGGREKMPIDNADQAAPETSKKWKDLIALSKIATGIREARKDFSAALPLVADGYYIGRGIWMRETIRDEKGLRIVFAPPWTGPYRVQHKGSNRLRSHAGEKARSFAQHSQWRDA